MALKSYEELIKVDVRQYCEERDGFTYLNWAKCIELLRQNGATEVYWEPIPDPRGESVKRQFYESAESMEQHVQSICEVCGYSYRAWI